MRKLIALLLCWPLWAGAATGTAGAEDWYVRPTTVCAENGDGLAFNCAASDGASGAFRGFNNLIWTTNDGIDDGDTLYVCGDFGGGSRSNTTNYVAATAQSGSSGSPITIDGDCSANLDNPSSWTNTKTGTAYSGARLDVEGVAPAGIRVGNVTWYVIQNLEITGATEYGIRTWVGGAEATTSKNIIIDGVWIHDNTSSDDGDGDSLISVFGEDVTVKNSVLENAPGDGLFANGANLTATDNYISNVGTGASAEGDCIQHTTNTDGSQILRNTCDHTSNDEKQCFIINGSSDNGAFTVADNICYGYVDASVMGGCFYLESTGAWKAERNFASGCVYGYNVADMGASSSLASNLSVGASSAAYRVGTTVTAAEITNNGGYGDSGIGLQSDTAGTGIAFRNNAMIGFPTCIDVQDGDNVDETNSCYGYSTGKSIDGTADTLSADTIIADPLFVGGSSPSTPAEFKLSPSSPLIDAGTCHLAVGCVHYDYDGKRARVPPDIGAFQRN